jgi:hypothetical protein
MKLILFCLLKIVFFFFSFKIKIRVYKRTLTNKLKGSTFKMKKILALMGAATLGVSGVASSVQIISLSSLNETEDNNFSSEAID